MKGLPPRAAHVARWRARSERLKKAEHLLEEMRLNLQAELTSIGPEEIKVNSTLKRSERLLGRVTRFLSKGRAP